MASIFFLSQDIIPNNIRTYFIYLSSYKDFLCSSAGKEFTCNAGDPSLIPGLKRSPGEGIGYPLQYSWVFLVAQTVKYPLSMRETWVQSLGWEDPPGGGHGNPLQNPHGQRIRMDRGSWRATAHGVTESGRTEQLSITHKL